MTIVQSLLEWVIGPPTLQEPDRASIYS